MSAQHTAGPWFVPAENAGSAATSVWARGGDVRVADCNSGAISLPGRQCDARLIAAAPDMLHALRRAALALAFAAETSPAMQDDYEAVSAAIARATGASHV